MHEDPIYRCCRYPCQDRMATQPPVYLQLSNPSYLISSIDNIAL